jgi:L-malate glycosyltransferase
MAGSGSLISKLATYTTELDLTSRIIFPGKIPYESMPSAYKAVDIFVMPSMSEALGVAALEASAMRLSVIATDTGGIPEVVKNSITGFLVPTSNLIEPLVEKIVLLATNPSLRSSLGTAGRQFVQSNFEFSALMQKADAFYASWG